MASPDVWGIADIMAQLDVSRVTVSKWRQRPGFPVPGYINRGSTAIWNPDDIRNWVREHAGTNAIRARASGPHPNQDPPPRA